MKPTHKRRDVTRTNITNYTNRTRASRTHLPSLDLPEHRAQQNTRTTQRETHLAQSTPPEGQSSALHSTNATHKSGYRPLLHASEELSEKRKRIWYTKREREREREGKERHRARARRRGSANYVSAAALHRQLAPRPSLCITPHQTSEESSQEGREERGEREQEMRRAEGGDKPYHAMQMRHACTREHMAHAQT